MPPYLIDAPLAQWLAQALKQSLADLMPESFDAD